MDVFPVAGLAAAPGFGLVGFVEAFNVLGGIGLLFVVGVFLALTPLLLSAASELLLVRHDYQVTVLVSELLPNDLY